MHPPHKVHFRRKQNCEEHLVLQGFLPSSKEIAAGVPHLHYSDTDQLSASELSCLHLACGVS